MRKALKEHSQLFSKILEEVPSLLQVGESEVLRQPTRNVSREEVPEIVEKLTQTLLEYRKVTGWGRGIAAPQIGISKAVFITYVDDAVSVFVNPKIIDKSDSLCSYRELCMSTGIVSVDIKRPEWIVMEWTDSTGKHQQEKFEGFWARLLQHESAHLKGCLTVDENAGETLEYVLKDPTEEVIREDA